MKLVYLKFLNFRKFKQEKLDFNSSFSVIFGKNWAWKSSVADSIWFALFWPNKDFIRWNKDDLKSYFASDKEPSKIELCFELSWIEYKIVRVISKWTKTFQNDFIEEKEDSLVFSWEKLVWWTEVTKYVEKLLWISRDVFLRSVFTKQKDIQVLSWDLSLQKKRELINKILWVDKLEEIIYEYNSDLKKEKWRLNDLKKDIESFDEEAINKEKEIHIKELSKIKDDLEKLNKNKEELSKKRLLIKENYIKNLDLKNDFDKINLEKIWLEKLFEDKRDTFYKKFEYLEELNIKKEYLKENQNIFKEKENIELKLKRVEENRIKFNQKTELLKEKSFINSTLINLKLKQKLLFDDLAIIEISEIEKDIKDFESKINKENEKKDKISNKISSLKTEIEIIKTQWANLRKEKNELLKLKWDAHCPTCKQKLWNSIDILITNYDSQISLKLEEYGKLESKILELDKDLKIILEVILSFKNKIEKLNDWNLKANRFLSDIQTYSLNLEKIEAKIFEFKEITFDIEEFNLVNNSYKKIEEKVNNLTKISWEIEKIDSLKEEVKKLEKDKDNLEKNISETEIKISKHSYDEWKYNKSFSDNIEIDSKVDSNFSEIIELKDLFNNQEKEIFKLDEKLRLNSESKEKMSIFIKNITEFEIKWEIVTKYKNFLISHLKPKIEDLASHYFSVMTDYKYATIEITEDYTIFIDWKSLEMYSGWEQDLANFCFRIALSQNITLLNSWNHINFMVLDEVLWSQDIWRRWNILASLKKLEDKFSQIILISHMDEVKDLATNLIEISAKNKFESEILEK